MNTGDLLLIVCNKIVDIDQYLLKLFENIQGSGFLNHIGVRVIKLPAYIIPGSHMESDHSCDIGF